MDISESGRLKAQEAENARLKKLPAESVLDYEALKAALSGMYRPRRPRPEAAAVMREHTPVSKRRACWLVGG